MNIKETLKRLKLAEGPITMILGAAVVIVVGILLFNYLRGVSKERKLGIPEEKVEEVGIKEVVPEAQPTPPASLPATYKTKKGDHLWKIAKQFYGSGYNWVDIAQANSLKNPNLIAADQELTVPDAPVRQPKGLPKTGMGEEKAIAGNTYTVARGDNLWKIAVRAYQDGFKWPEIAKANNLANPNLIHPGNILKLPR